jgi:hypothetical protein
MTLKLLHRLVAVVLLSVPLHADIIINEVVHAASDRQLKWSAPHPTGIPRLGTGPAFYETSYTDGADKGWQTGQAPFGFGTFTPTGPTFGTVTQTQMQYLTPALYLRKAITVSATDSAKTDNLQLSVEYNDGFIIYINGVEVARRWAGPAGQFQYHDQHAYDPDFASATTDPNKYTENINLGPANSRLVTGTNLIAVHALNLSSINANFLFSANLQISGASPSTLIGATDTWKFFPGVVEPAGGLYDPSLLFAGRLSVPWGKITYTDTTWNQGAGPHGQGIAGLGTSVSGIIGSTPSLYTRIVFNADTVQATSTTPLELLVDFDDSFVAYINGVEVARANQGTPNTFVPKNAVATAARNFGTTTTYTIDPARNVLVNGANVLAIQTHNLSVADSDLGIKADLRLGGSGGAMLVVNNSSSWRYLVGAQEPVVDVDGAVEDNPDSPESVNDWVELYNNGATAVSLNGWSLSDDSASPRKWAFPNVTIASGGYLVVICDGQDIKAPGLNGYLHADFKLDSDGEFLGLYDSNGTAVQQINPLPKGSPHHSVGINSAGNYVYFDFATPGSANSGNEFTGMASAPTVSVPGGFYSSGQSITLSTITPGATIRYTDTENSLGPQDGSLPTLTSGIVASGPISVATSRSIRAVAFAPGLIPSPHTTHTYLIAEPSPRSNLPAVTLVGDQPRSLYRPYGVMAIQNNVAGAAGNYPAGPWSALGDNQQYNNPNFRGIWGERPVTWQYLAANGQSLFNLDIGLRMAGSPFTRPRYILAGPNGATPNTTAWSTSDALNKPSMNLYMRDDLGGDPLDFPIITNSPVTKHSDFRFRGGHNDLNPFILDELARRLFIDTGNKGGLGINTTLYINAKYKGIFNLVQHLRQEWMREAFNSDLDWDVLQVAVPSDGDGIAFQEMFTFLRNNPQNILANYQGMEARLDMAGFIDYLLVNIYGAGGDWPHNNWISAKERSTSGKWRFFVWDAEGGYGSFGLTVTSNNFVASPQNNGAAGTQSSLISTAPQTEATSAAARVLYTLLRESPEFKLLFADRIQKHFFNGGALTDAAILARHSALMAECSPFISGFNASRVPNWVNGINDSTRYSVTRNGTGTITATANAPGRRRVLFDGFTADAAYANIVAGFNDGYFKVEGLWPATLAPTFSQHGGSINAPFALTISNPNGSGSIYYTTNGLDPRLAGGVAQGTLYSGPITLSSTTVVKARVVTPSGSWSPLIEATFSTTAVAPLLITEIMYNPPDFTPSGGTLISGSEFEFIELKNASAQPLNLNGLRFRDGIEFAFPAGATLAANSHLILARNSTQFALKYPGIPVFGQYGPSTALGNGGDTLTIEDAAKNTVFSVTYDDSLPWPVAADGTGRSLVPILPNSNTAPNLSSSWRASTAVGGSPGTDDAPNGIVAVAINEILANSTLPTEDAIELHNPSATEIANISDWWLSDDLSTPKKYRIPSGTTIPPQGFLVIYESQFNTGSNPFALSSNGDQVVLSSGDSSGEITGYSAFAEFGASDTGVTMAKHSNNEIPPRVFFAAQQTPTLGAPNSGPKIGPIIITEIHYRPNTAASEFIEIRNNSNQPVPLFDPANPSNTWRIEGVDFYFPPGVTLQPREFAIVSAVAPSAFRTSYAIAPNIEIYGPYAPAELLNTGERVALQKPGTPYLNNQGQTVVPYIDIDFATYKPTTPWPTQANGGGRSMERAKSNGFSDDATTWKASTTNSGNAGTLGAVTFSNWQSQWFNTITENGISGINFDADGDGLSNGLEYALGRNPRAPDSSDALTSALEMDGANGPFLTLRFKRSLSIQGAQFTPEVSGGLGGSWLSDAASVVQVGTPENNGDGSQTVRVRDAMPVSGQSQRFIRLKVMLP